MTSPEPTSEPVIVVVEDEEEPDTVVKDSTEKENTSVITVPLVGPPGPPGPPGEPGRDVQRFVGHGPPGTLIGAQPDDEYLDIDTMDLYILK